MQSRYTITLSAVDKQGRDSWHMAVDTDEFPIFSDRFVDDMRGARELGIGSFDATVSAIKARVFRRDYLLAAAKSLAARLADYIEDKEGWHGERRQEAIRRAERPPNP